jgi:phosphatidylglycerol:prolipoprotein diacylglycerol transferase
MFPVLASFGPISVSSIGFFIALAFFFGGFGIWKKAKEEHFEDDDIFDALFLTFFGGLIGARLFYILLHFSQFGFDLARWINLAYSNQFSWLGFLAGTMYVLSILAKKKKWDYFAFLDYSVLGVIAAQLLVRIGQFLDGSYVGVATNFITALPFPGMEGRHHPLALYDFLLTIFVFYLIKALDKQYRLYKWYQNNRGEAQPGFLWLSYLLAFSIIQFGLDFFDVRKTLLLVFSSYQFVLLFVIGLTIFGFWLRAGNKISFLSSSKENKTEPIRPPVEPVQPRERPKRFARAKAGKTVNFK